MNSLLNVLNKCPKLHLVTSKLNYSSFRSSPFVCDLTPSVKYEISQNPEEWTFVERLLPAATVPKPSVKPVYHSEWRPQTVQVDKYPYFLKRSRNHMLPVYLIVSYRGMRRITRIRNIEGDIWELEKDIKKFLQPMHTKPIRTQVNEFSGIILIHGDHVNALKYWLQEKHF